MTVQINVTGTDPKDGSEDIILSDHNTIEGFIILGKFKTRIYDGKSPAISLVEKIKTGDNLAEFLLFIKREGYSSDLSDSLIEQASKNEQILYDLVQKNKQYTVRNEKTEGSIEIDGYRVSFDRMNISVHYKAKEGDYRAIGFFSTLGQAFRRMWLSMLYTNSVYHFASYEDLVNKGSELLSTFNKIQKESVSKFY